MYSKIKTINGVVGLSASDNDLIYFQKNGLNFNGHEYDYEIEHSSLMYFDHGIYSFQDFKGSFFIIHDNKVIRTEYRLINKYNQGYLFQSSSRRISRGIFSKSYIYSDFYLDSEFKIKIKSTPYDLIQLTPNLSLFQRKNEIIFSDFETFDETSSNSENIIKLHSDNFWSSFIGVINGLFFFYLSNNTIQVANSRTLKCFNIGYSSQFFGDSNIDEELRPYPFFRTDYLLNKDKTCIYGLAMDLFYELKVENDEVISVAYSLKKEFDRLGINHEYISKNNVLHGKHFYFMLEDLLRFAVLDVETKEIVFLSDEIGVSNNQGAFTKLKEIQVTDSKAYVLASDNVLHVFNKV